MTDQLQKNFKKTIIAFRGIVFLVGAFELWIFLKFWFSATFWPDFVVSYANIWSALAMLPAIAAAYILFKLAGSFENFDAKLFKKGKALRFAFWTVAVYVALFTGIAFTVLGFGAEGPFGSVMQGIKGFKLPISVGFWPMVFLVGFGFIMLQASGVYRQIREKS